jgi:serine/threonine protein kinase
LTDVHAMGSCSSHSGPNPRALDLSHFEEMRTVGKGGFGKVTAVMEIDPATGKTFGPAYAMKRQMKSQLIKSKSWLDMMWVEREIMEQAQSCFLTRLLATFQSPTEVFFVMDLMEGGDLRYHLKQQSPFPQETTRFYAAQMLLGLECLHQLGILYRDLKPENCLLDGEGNLYLSDFGLSVVLGRDGEGIAKKAHGKSGTRDYMAPEMLAGQHYGLEVDWWALGITVHEILTRRFPKITTGCHLCFQIRLEPATKAFLRSLLDPDTNAISACTSMTSVANCDNSCELQD